MPRMSGLTDPYLKLGRAKLHLDNLKSEIDTFRAGKPYEITSYDDLERQQYVMTFRLFDVPDNVSLIAGDSLYCMRSSLGQLIWALAKRLGGIVNPTHTQFPVIDIDNSDGRKRFDTQTAGIPDNVLEVIKGFQPYRRGTAYKSHPLWRLNALGNIDKHRRIPANGSEMVVYLPNAAREFVSAEVVDDIQSRISVPLIHKDKLQLQPTITFNINFGQGHPADADSLVEGMEGLCAIHDFFETLYSKFSFASCPDSLIPLLTPTKNSPTLLTFMMPSGGCSPPAVTQ